VKNAEVLQGFQNLEHSWETLNAKTAWKVHDFIDSSSDESGGFGGWNSLKDSKLQTSVAFEALNCMKL
jgi:hypothetical protein